MSLRSARAVVWVLLVCPLTARAQPPSGVKAVEYEAKSVGRTLRYFVALPDGYESGTERYPVLYLLHGYSGNYNSWARHRAQDAARPHGLIVVMPDGGNSWFVNWSASENGQKNAWEDSVVKDLVPHVDATYRTIPRREGRAINGLSMGGYGALVVGLRNPELFAAVGSHSGSIAYAHDLAERFRKGEDPVKGSRPKDLSTAPRAEIGVPGFSTQEERTPRGRIFASAEEADAHDPFVLVTKVPRDKLPHLYVDCGTDDPFLKHSRDFLAVLMQHKIPFTYAESPGEHRSAYWRREIGHSMAVQSEVLRRARSQAENPRN